MARYADDGSPSLNGWMADEQSTLAEGHRGIGLLFAYMLVKSNPQREPGAIWKAKQP